MSEIHNLKRKQRAESGCGWIEAEFQFCVSMVLRDKEIKIFMSGFL